jgi:hypothetical protein
MKSRQTHAVVYSGKVGAKMEQEPHKMPSKITPKVPIKCKLGPMGGNVLWLATDNTLPFTYKGQTGRYVGGVWEKAK